MPVLLRILWLQVQSLVKGISQMCRALEAPRSNALRKSCSTFYRALTLEPSVSAFSRNLSLQIDDVLQMMCWQRRLPRCTVQQLQDRHEEQLHASGAACADLQRHTSACGAGHASARASAMRCTPRRAASSLLSALYRKPA